MSHTTVSRRAFLKALAATGVAGAAGLSPLSAFALPAGSTAPRTMTETRLLMGTFVSITLAQASRGHMDEAMEQAFQFMDGRIRLFDRHDAASPLGLLNSQGSLADAPADLTHLLNLSARIGHITNGAFNITVQPLVDLFRRYSNPSGSMSIPEAELREARELVLAGGWSQNGNSLRMVRSGMGITLDGIAKGHIADEVSAFLKQQGLLHHLINAGGDIVACGEKAPGRPWLVAVDQPDHSGFVRRLSLRDGALASSGSYEMFYDASHRHHHLISPAAGDSPTALSSVSVLAPSAMEADALATALSVMPPRDGLRLIASLPAYSCLMLTREGRILTSAGWPV